MSNNPFERPLMGFPIGNEPSEEQPVAEVINLHDYRHTHDFSAIQSAYDEKYGMSQDAEHAAPKPGITERMGYTWRRPFIGAKFVIDAFSDDFTNEWQDSTRKERSLQSAVVIAAPAAQVYERARVPEVLGVAVATSTFNSIYEKTGNAATAIAVSSITLAAAVYAQQKVIGKTWVETAELFPSAYETVNEQWPKSTQAAREIIPNNSSALAEGATMFALGTTPFILAAKSANPAIDKNELSAVEKRVTRRGSIFAGGVGAGVLGVRSYAHYVPTKAGEILTNTSIFIVDTVSSPVKLIAILAGTTILGKLGTKVKNKFSKSAETVEPSVVS